MIKAWMSVSVVVASVFVPALKDEHQGAASLDEVKLFVEYDSTNGEAVFVMEADVEEPADALSNVVVRNHMGTCVLRLAGASAISGGVSEFAIQSSKRQLAELQLAVPAGRYEIVGRTVSGQVVASEAFVSHELPAAPVILAPLSQELEVDAGAFVVAWTDDPNAESYRIVLEQDEKDGLTALVPGGINSLAIPAGILAPQTRTLVEVASIAANGNITISEIECRTR